MDGIAMALEAFGRIAAVAALLSGLADGCTTPTDDAASAPATVVRTSAPTGADNPLRLVPSQAPGAILGLPASGYAIEANRSTDGSFSTKDEVETHHWSYDKTTAAGAVFVNPVGVPLGDDSSHNLDSTVYFLTSNGQKTLNDCVEGDGFTVAEGRITTVTAVPPPCQGNKYAPNSKIVMQLYVPYGMGTGCQFTATTNPAGAITGYAGLPCGSGAAASGTLLFFQPPPSACPNGGCRFDLNNELYLMHQPPGYWPQAGSFVGSINFAGATNRNDAVGPPAMYSMIVSGVTSPAVAHPRGFLQFATADDPSVNAGNTPRMQVGSGAFMIGYTGGDPGPGNFAAETIMRRGDWQCASPSSTLSSNCTATLSYPLGAAATGGWRTLQTLSPSTVAGAFAQGMVECVAMGHTRGVGAGVRTAHWYFDIASANPTVGRIQPDAATPHAPRIVLAAAGTDILLRVAGADGTHPLDSGFARCAFFLPEASGQSVAWSVR
jgi:hypothetical protein